MTEPQDSHTEADQASLLDAIVDWIRAYSQDDCGFAYEDGAEAIVRSFCEIDGIQRLLRLPASPQERPQTSQGHRPGEGSHPQDDDSAAALRDLVSEMIQARDECNDPAFTHDLKIASEKAMLVILQALLPKVEASRPGHRTSGPSTKASL